MVPVSSRLKIGCTEVRGNRAPAHLSTKLMVEICCKNMKLSNLAALADRSPAAFMYPEKGLKG